MNIFGNNKKFLCIVLIVSLTVTTNAMAVTINTKSLTADQLIYNKTRDIIIAKGHVKISYNGNYITSDRVEYNKKTNNILAIGNVSLKDKNGNIIHSNRADLTKDLSTGFIKSLQAETQDNTYFSAKTAQNIAQGHLTIFNNASYTACKTCDVKHATRPALWRIKAKKIIWDRENKKLNFKNSHFDIMGNTVLHLPDFTIPDYSVKRYSGFLAPTINYNKYLGYGVIGAYFFNLSPNYDLTLRLGNYTQQGFIASGNWRQHLQNGIYDLIFAYIKQKKPQLFQEDSIDSKKRSRLMLGSKATYNINKRWKLGWDLLLQSDEDFSRSYNIDGYNNYVHTSNVYLEGLGKYNYFNLSFYHFNVQAPYLDLDRKHNQNKYNALQPWVLPQITYNYRAPKTIYGGILKFATNTRTIYRTDTDYDNIPIRFNVKGTNARLTQEISWEKLIISKCGLLIRPLLALRADLQAISSPEQTDELHSKEAHGLVTAGIELRYPMIIKSHYGVQTLEPIAQFYLRNNIKNAETFPNEDAQDLTFSALSLFQRDKFSGYDRIEYGSRANIGVRYYTKLGHYLDIYALAGQSFQLSAKNPFASNNLVPFWQGSGLEHARSDYVSMIQLRDPTGLALTFRERFDYKDLSLRRNEIDLTKNWTRFGATLHYTHLAKRAFYAVSPSQTQLAGIENLKLTQNWQIGAYQNLDLTSHQLINIGSALTYQNDCLALTLLYSRTKGFDKTLPNDSFGFRLNLRTIMELHNN